MHLTESMKDRLALALKSGAVGAVLLLTATVWAQPQDIDLDGEQVAVLTTAMLSDTVTDRQNRASLFPADAATAATLAHQRRLDRLADHIQDRYQVTDGKARRIVDAAIRSAETHQLEPELILAIIAVESMFNERAVSRVGARGLMQVMPGVHSDKVREIGGRHALFDPAKNIYTGAQILSDYLDDQSGNLRRALLRYNGSLNLRSSAYPEKVMRVYRDLRRATFEG